MQLSPHVGNMYTLPIIHHAQITADDTGGTTVNVPFAGRIVKAVGTVEAIGGGTPFTDVDLVVKHGSTVVATLAAVNSSAIVAGGGTAEPNYSIAADEDLELEIDITGGASSPTADGINVLLFIVRE